MSRIKLGDRVVTADSFPYIIAEIGVNHEGSLDTAKHLIDLAKEGGADAAKFQTYKADTLASKNSPSYWDTKEEKSTSQHSLFQRYDRFEQDDYHKLAEHCSDIGIQFVSTPFDHDAVDFLDPISAFYKIASADITNLPLLEKTAAKGKPVILSTGASTIDEIRAALDILGRCGCKEIAILHCILNYPTPSEFASIKMIQGLRAEFPDHVIGYSDHTLPGPIMLPVTIAYCLGAAIIEKHFTHDKTLPGNDHYHAMDVNDLKQFRENLEQARILLGGQSDKNYLPSEEISRANARRSIFFAKNLRAGSILSEDDLICKRPGIGVSPMLWQQVVGRELSTDVATDQPLDWADLREL